MFRNQISIALPNMTNTEGVKRAAKAYLTAGIYRGFKVVSRGLPKAFKFGNRVIVQLKYICGLFYPAFLIKQLDLFRP